MQMEARAADGKLAPGQGVIGLCRGIQAFADGDYSSAAPISAGSRAAKGADAMTYSAKPPLQL